MTGNGEKAGVGEGQHGSVRRGMASSAGLLSGLMAGALFCVPAVWGQKGQTAPVVQPGAPGMPSKRLPDSTTGQVPQRSPADVAFMQGMIMHHGQAVEMTALIASHTENADVLMKRWLTARGEAISMAMPGMPDMDMSGMPMAAMPGMLTEEQMEALRGAKGAAFDRLFLTGMMQHHNGALVMVKQLFDTPGAGQDADLFEFATDVDNSQRAEIKIMQNLLKEK